MDRLTYRAARLTPVFGVSVLLWASCSLAAATGQDHAAPQLAVGDHWQYRVTDNLRRGAQSRLDVEVIAVADQVARVRYRRTEDSGTTEWIDEVDSEGVMRNGSLYHEPSRPLDPPARLLSFPLDKGKTWRQTIDTVRKDTGLKDQILIYGKVEGPAGASVPAGPFNTIYVYRIVQLDDSEAWRSRTTLRDSIWYAPAVKGAVQEKREAQYTQRDARNPVIRTESLLLELVSFQPGKQ